jgi:hypothetical protein
MVTISDMSGAQDRGNADFPAFSRLGTNEDHRH